MYKLVGFRDLSHVHTYKHQPALEENILNKTYYIETANISKIKVFKDSSHFQGISTEGLENF